MDYTAHVVSKFNTRQPDGLVYVDTSQEEEESEEPVETGAEEETTEQDAVSQMEQNDGQAQEEAQPVSMTLTEALQIAGVDAQVTSTELGAASYEEGDYYAMDASAGKTFLVVHVTLSNQTAEDISVDLLSGQPQFGAEVNGAGAVSAEMTVLSNDLATYQGTLAAGSSVDTALLFQVPADGVTQVDTLEHLTLHGTGTVYTIPCL